TRVVRDFVAEVKTAIQTAVSPEDAITAIRPRFSELLADPEWLPSHTRRLPRRAAWAVASAIRHRRATRPGARRLLRVDPTHRRHPSGAHHLGRDLRVNSSPHKR